MDMNKLLENYGCLTFSDDIMRERIPKSTYKAGHFFPEPDCWRAEIRD